MRRVFTPRCSDLPTGTGTHFYFQWTTLQCLVPKIIKSLFDTWQIRIIQLKWQNIFITLRMPKRMTGNKYSLFLVGFSFAFLPKLHRTLHSNYQIPECFPSRESFLLFILTIHRAHSNSFIATHHLH